MDRSERAWRRRADEWKQDRVFVAEDAARDSVYTASVARRLVDTFQKENVALPTNVVAFVFFELLRRKS